MKKVTNLNLKVFMLSFFLVMVPLSINAQTQQPKPGLPPISQQVVREGNFAVRLQAALGLGTNEDETEAENALGDAGVIPRNGWIADYPVTPDIIGELQKSVGDAADAGRIKLDRVEALQRLDTVSADVSLAIKPQTNTATYAEIPEGTAATEYPNPTVINNYYETEGPPIVTYYSPPPDYYYLYGWIPYPFWWAGFWFPGYFILHDFYRPYSFHNRVSFVSNHFNDIRSHHVFRIDPTARFNGRTYAGIGVSNQRGFLSTGVSGSQRSIFNAPRAQATPGMRPLPGMRSSYRTTQLRGSTYSKSNRSAARSVSAPSHGGGRSMSSSSGKGGGGSRGSKGK